MKFKHCLLASSALLAAAISASAHAQTTLANTIEELVVTAEKREQSLQDVPVAVSAFTSERRDLIGITTIQDMTNFTPGLQYSSQLDRTSLRGVGRLTNVHAAEGAVAIYSDGIYTTSTVEAGKAPIFTDRVEVLRGPQGTLYGRNAIGGAINVISKRPTEEWYAEVRARYENYNRSVIEAAASGPTMIDGVQFRIAASWDRQTEGWIDNIIPGAADEGNIIDTRILEGQLKLHFGENFEGWIKVSTSQWNNSAGGPGSRYSWTPASYPTYQAANLALVLNPGYGCRPGTGVTNVVNLSPAGCVNPAISDPRKIATSVPYHIDLNDTVIVASEWIYHAQDFDVKYLLGGTRYHYRLTSPQTEHTAPITSYRLPTVFNLPGNLVINPRYGATYQEIETWTSHELNIASTNDSSFQWLLGAYYFREDYEQPVYTTLFDQPQVNGPFAVPSVFCARTGGACPPTTNENRIYDNRPELKIRSKALFGQVDWEFLPTLKTTLGLRHTWDHKYGVESVRVLCFAVPTCLAAPELNPVLPGVIGSGIRVVDLSQTPTVVSFAPAEGVVTPTTVDPATGFASRRYDNKWSATTGTAGLQWDPAPDTMVYARYSRGYKAGGFRIGIDTVLGASPNTDAEHADSYEIGLKKNVGGRLQANIAAFYYDYTDAQVPITVTNTSGGLAQAQSIFYNIPKAISKGIEFESILLPFEGLQIALNYSYLDAYVKESQGVVDPADPAALDPAAVPLISLAECQARAVDANPANNCSPDIFTAATGGGFQRGQDLKGNPLPNAPKHKVAVNVNYTWNVGDLGSLTASGTYIWRDVQYGSIFKREYYRSPSYDQVDARLTYKPEGGKFTAILYVRNLFDDIGYEGGATASRRAGTVPVINGTTVTQVPIVDPVLTHKGLRTNGIASTYPLTPPRTYGLELQYRF